MKMIQIKWDKSNKKYFKLDVTVGVIQSMHVKCDVRKREGTYMKWAMVRIYGVA